MAQEMDTKKRPDGDRETSGGDTAQPLTGFNHYQGGSPGGEVGKAILEENVKFFDINWT